MNSDSKFQSNAGKKLLSKNIDLRSYGQFENDIMNLLL